MAEEEFTQGHIEGTGGESWASWLVENKQEIDEITNPELKIEVRLLARRPENMINQATLEKAYERIDRLLREGKISDEQAGVWMERISKRHQELSTPRAGFNPEEFARAMGVPMAEEVEELYRRAEGAMSGIEISVGQEPKFLIGKEQPEKDYWIARAKLSSACNIKSTAPSYDKLFPNDYANKITIHDLELLLGKQSGTWDALSLYSALVAEKAGDASEVGGLNPQKLLAEVGWDRFGPALRASLQARREDLLGTCPKGIFDITTDQQLTKLRESMVYWLMSHDKLNESQAKDAEHIAWNLIYLSNLVEQYDSRIYRPGRDRIPPSVPPLKSLATWMMMHPQERLEAKIDAGEAWSSFGEWTLNLRKSYRGGIVPEVIPTELFKNVFALIKINNTELETILRQNGKVLLSGGSGGPTPDLSAQKETPFGSYYFDIISPAILVFSVVAKGEQRDRRISELGDAMRKLAKGRESPLSRREKENILMAWNGVASRSANLYPEMGTGRWRDYLRQLNRYAPNFFKD